MTSPTKQQQDLEKNIRSNVARKRPLGKVILKQILEK